MTDLAITVGGVRLNAPVLPASGTFGLGHGRVYDLARLGALVPKTVTLTPRTGHPPPRMAETGHGLVNAIGIPSEGLDAFLAEALALWRARKAPLVVSLQADRAGDLTEMTRRLSVLEAGAQPDGLEINLSCPNLERGGLAFALSPKDTADAVAAARKGTDLPLWAKLAPNASDPVAVANAAADAGADALVVANTMPVLPMADGRAPLANRTGGLSGPALKPINLRLVDMIAREVRVDLIACGGIARLPDILDAFAFGARAVSVGTAALMRPTALIELIDALAAHLEREGVALSQLIEGARCNSR